MKPARIVDIALRAYPEEVRRASGGEMLGTALDLSAGSWRGLGRESVGLVRGGLRARAKISAEARRRRLVTDACCQAATLLGTVGLAGTMARYMLVRVPRIDLVTVSISDALLAGFVMLALLGYDRLAGICGIASVAAGFVEQLASYWGLGAARPSMGYLLAAQPVMLLFYGVMVVAPRRRRRDPRRLLWLVGTFVFAAALRAALGSGLYLTHSLVVTLLLTASSMAMILLPIVGLLLVAMGPPRLAIVAALVWTAIGFPDWIAMTRLDAFGEASLIILLEGIVALAVIVVLAAATTIRLRSLGRELSR